MPKFRTKPVVKEAIQWTGDNRKKVTAFLAGTPYYFAEHFKWVLIHNLESDTTAKQGDWIIKESCGFYSCTPDVFAATYEPVDG